ncbi:uncharacterized protein LOC129791870 [Lutzomyia longipalpis]|uniref:uncharacterized protein LOC129791870 n=1 Tax=Lutzomyia longipalpis TaxID=7200 RepID=UPI002483B217|nr:uncharacterized protein LOC129791870 [Lutzomyia longipalpis]
MAGVKGDKAAVEYLKNWRIPRDFTPEQIIASRDGFFLRDEERIIKFSGNRNTKEPQITFFEDQCNGFLEDEFLPCACLPGTNILGASTRLNGWIIFHNHGEGDFSLNFCSKDGEIQQEVKLCDVFEEDFLQELSLDESHMQCIEFSPTNMDFLCMFLNIDASSVLIGREIVLFSMGSALNVLKRNQDDEWDVSMVKSFAEDIKCLWYSSHFDAIFTISALGIVKVAFLVGNTIKEETIFLTQKYLNIPKLLSLDKLCGISWTFVDIIAISRSDDDKFSCSLEKISLPGVVDVIHHPKWNEFVAVTENKFIYVLQEKREQQTQQRVPDWRKNRENFKEYISNLMESSTKIVMEAKVDNHILNCLGFLRNFFVATHEVTIKVSLRQSLGENVEIDVQPSEKIAQMDFSQDTQWSLAVFNATFCQQFALKANHSDTFSFMLPEKQLMESPLKVDVSVEFSLEGEHFLLTYPLRIVFSAQGASPGNPLVDFYSKIEALAGTSVAEYASQWAQVEQLNEKKLSTLALKLHRMIVEGASAVQQVEQMYAELRTKDAGL